mmetsp:Transcript_11548/g.42238  ORF Transcript_11548/g.42238 Transcript_11548/m.42238 type:complete len:1091 (-) Transcript_11548:113-3385(-)
MASGPHQGGTAGRPEEAASPQRGGGLHEPEACSDNVLDGVEEPPMSEGGGEGEEEEEEPQLKYQRLGASIPAVLAKDAASCICVTDRMVALGTHDGAVYVLDFDGNEVKHFSGHSATVNEISFDREGEFIASCSDDGSVVIAGLYSEEVSHFSYKRPLKAVALEPGYARKTSKQFVCGGLAGELVINAKRWLGHQEHVIHKGEGAIHAIQWRGSLIAWANDYGVKVYDCSTNQRIAYIDRPRGSPRADLYRPTLCWSSDTLLIVAWADFIKVAKVKSEAFSDHTHGVSAAAPGASQSMSTTRLNAFTSGGSLDKTGLYMEIVAQMQTDFVISGLVPYHAPETVLVLAFLDQEEASESVGQPVEGVTSRRPEVVTLTWSNEELSSDALTINGFEHYKANDYRLAASQPSRGFGNSCEAWAEGDEPLYYIVSPKDIVLARPRDTVDHLHWLMDKNHHDQALKAAEKAFAAGKIKESVVQEVGVTFIRMLLSSEDFEGAASLCTKILKTNQEAWESWVYHFASINQLHALAPYIPTKAPRLSSTMYDLVLHAFLEDTASFSKFLAMVREWPPELYSLDDIVSAVLHKLQELDQVELCLLESENVDLLREALAELYVAQGHPERTLDIYTELRRPRVFDFIRSHKLFWAIREKIVPLLGLHPTLAVQLFLEHREEVPPRVVVGKVMEGASSETELRHRRQLLHEYLHELWLQDAEAGAEFHMLQIELYAEFDTQSMLPFLQSSQHYPLEKALDVCEKHRLIREQVFVLGRMGNSQEALVLILEELLDVKQAIEFVHAQRDPGLRDELIQRAFARPQLAADLLQHIGSDIEPLELLRHIPLRMPIPGLRDRLTRIVSDMRTEKVLREDCNTILKKDRMRLFESLLEHSKMAVRLGSPQVLPPYHSFPSQAGQNAANGKVPSPASKPKDGGHRVRGGHKGHGTAAAPARVERKQSIRNSGRCCLCLDFLESEQGRSIVFCCGHAYHDKCLRAALHSEDTDKGPSGPAAPHSSTAPSKIPVLRCLLCTQAMRAEGRHRKTDGTGRSPGKASNGGEKLQAHSTLAGEPVARSTALLDDPNALQRLQFVGYGHQRSSIF